MVWGLFPVDSPPGEQKYFIFSKGTYKVGRKGCDVIINTDKGVSRIHSEIIVESMASVDPLQRRSSNLSSAVRIRDCSKYGTFINKKLGSKAKVHEFPDKVTNLKDGDLISFGTGNATYRFCFVPLVFFVCCKEPVQVDPSLQEQFASIGACSTLDWNIACTHALVDESSPVKDDLFDAILAQKPIILKKWVKAVAGKSITTEFPSYAEYFPVLTFEGSPIKVVDPKARENSLAGYTFILGASHLYRFGDRFFSLLNVGGAKVLSINEFCSNSQASEDGASNRVVLVIPLESANQFNAYQHLRSLSRVNDVNLISAVLSGRLDPSIVESAPILVSSSCSTDETIVADSDAETDTAASDGISAKAQALTINHEEPNEAMAEDYANCPTEIFVVPSSEVEEDGIITKKDKGASDGMMTKVQPYTIDHEEYKETMMTEIHANGPKEKSKLPSFNSEDDGIITKKEKYDEIDTSCAQNSDIIFSQALIVRDTNALASFQPSTIKEVPNFKRFRKRETQSGNSFTDLIPFSKYPYRESEYGSEEVAEHVKEEKRRKRMEAIAEDLFHHEKARKRGGVGSIRELLARS